MSNHGKKLLTPIFLKTEPDSRPPEKTPVSYLLTRDGLFIRRHHPFFTSCVPARDFPAELLPQKPLLDLSRCPKVPKTAMQRIVGFFSRIARLHGSEAAVLLYWDRKNQRIVFEVPDQEATVNEGWNGGRYPTDVRYEMPQVDPDWSLFGSVHSHVEGLAYSSSVDRHDESHLTGLHIVVGRISHEPPDLHCEFVVDGVRFPVDARTVIEGYEKRDIDVPNEWIRKVEVELKSYEHTTTYYDGRYDTGPARRRMH